MKLKHYLDKHGETLEKLAKEIEESFEKYDDTKCILRCERLIIPIIFSALRAIAEQTTFGGALLVQPHYADNLKLLPHDPSEAIAWIVKNLLNQPFEKDLSGPIYWQRLMERYVETDSSLSLPALTAFFNEIKGIVVERPQHLEEKAVRDRPVVSLATHHSTTFTSASSSSFVQQSTSSLTTANTAAVSTPPPPRQPH